MRTLTLTLTALAFLWACGATAYLLVASSPTGIATSTMLAGGVVAERMPPPLATANGVWMAGVFIGVTLLAGIPLGVAWALPSAHRPMAWTAAAVLLGLGLVAGFFVMLLYLPSTILLGAAGALGSSGPGDVPVGGLGSRSMTRRSNGGEHG